jgi:hypothetical protein
MKMTRPMGSHYRRAPGLYRGHPAGLPARSEPRRLGTLEAAQPDDPSGFGAERTGAKNQPSRGRRAATCSCDELPWLLIPEPLQVPGGEAGRERGDAHVAAPPVLPQSAPLGSVENQPDHVPTALVGQVQGPVNLGRVTVRLFGFRAAVAEHIPGLRVGEGLARKPGSRSSSCRAGRSERSRRKIP